MTAQTPTDPAATVGDRTYLAVIEAAAQIGGLVRAGVIAEDHPAATAIVVAADALTRVRDGEPEPTRTDQSAARTFLAPADPPAGGAEARPFGWARYERTCAPDRVISGLGDLCYFLGGEWGKDGGGDASFTAHLLKLIVKAQSTPDRFAALEQAFPREVLAWRVWMAMPSIPTAAGLCTALTALSGDQA